MFLQKAMCPINALSKKLQEQHSGFDEYTHAFARCIEELEKLTTEAAATFRARSRRRWPRSKSGYAS